MQDQEARSQNETRNILDLVREFRASGGFYDDDAVAYVADQLGCEPSRELSRACYHAKGQLHDEQAQQKVDGYLADGFSLARDIQTIPGSRYEVRRGTVYVGRDVADYGSAAVCKATVVNGKRVMLPGRNRTREARSLQETRKNPQPWPIRPFEVARAYVIERDGCLYVYVNHTGRGFELHPAVVWA